MEKVLFLWRRRVHLRRICSGSLTIHLGEKCGKPRQNPTWHKRRGFTRRSCKFLMDRILLNTNRTAFVKIIVRLLHFCWHVKSQLFHLSLRDGRGEIRILFKWDCYNTTMWLVVMKSSRLWKWGLSVQQLLLAAWWGALAKKNGGIGVWE